MSAIVSQSCKCAMCFCNLRSRKSKTKMGLSLVSVLLGLVANQIHLFRTTNFGYAQSLFVDVRCECRNPECEEMKKAVGKANIKDKVASSSKSSNSAYFSFSNVNAKLIHQLYPAVASTKYPFIERSLGAIHTKRRRSFFSLDQENDMLAKLVGRYQGFYRDNTLCIYLELVQKISKNERRACPVPSKVAPPSAKRVMAEWRRLFKKAKNDREMIIWNLSALVPEHTWITDYSFEVARLLDGDSSCRNFINEKYFKLVIQL